MNSRTDISLDFNRVYSDRVGPMGLSDGDLEKIGKASALAHAAICGTPDAGRPGFLDLPDDVETARAVAAAAQSDRGRFKNFVVCGIGGSALGNIALQSALNHPFYNELPPDRRDGRPRVIVLDNVDPDLVSGALDVLDPAETLFNVTSKSGETAETMAQFMLVCDLLKKRLGSKAGGNLIITTDTDRGPLRQAAKELRCRSFSVPGNVGGRFSVLSPVGLLSAAYAGIDVEAVLEGARRMRARCADGDLKKNPALLYAAVHYIFNKLRGANISVVFSYSHRLRDLADWYRQLLAESLGKRHDLSGKEVFEGVTPVNALGVTDQHSQVQLYAEGPKDKTFTFLAVEKFGAQVAIPGDGAPVGQEYLAGSSFNSLIDAELRGTELALEEAGRPSCRIVFPSIDPHRVGQFIFLMELHIAYSGVLYNVNAFDQPGVEAGKKATFAFMGREGYEELREKIEGRGKRADRIL